MTVNGTVAGGMVASLAQAAAGADPGGWIDLLRRDVAPVGAAYVALLAMLVAFARSRRAGARPRETRRGAGAVPERASAPSWGSLLRYLVGITVGGYALFLLIVVTFYFVLGGEDRTFIWQALGEGSVLAFAMVIPGFLLISWLHDRPWSRRGRSEEAGRSSSSPYRPMSRTK